MNTGFKLFRLRADGSIGPLFINARLRIPIGEWLEAEMCHRKAGFAYRPGWHILAEQSAPHLSKRGRVWAEVEFDDAQEFRRPESQGGRWFLAWRMRVTRLLPG